MVAALFLLEKLFFVTEAITKTPFFCDCGTFVKWKPLLTNIRSLEVAGNRSKWQSWVIHPFVLMSANRTAQTEPLLAHRSYREQGISLTIRLLVFHSGTQQLTVACNNVLTESTSLFKHAVELTCVHAAGGESASIKCDNREKE